MYTVIYNSIDVASPVKLQLWLDKMLEKGLELVAVAGISYFIFKPLAQEQKEQALDNSE